MPSLSESDKRLILSAIGQPEAANTIIALLSQSGTGNVSGPVSSTDNALARFDGSTGAILQNSPIIIDDAGAISGVSSILSDTSSPTGALSITKNSDTGLLTLAGGTSAGAGKINAYGVNHASKPGVLEFITNPNGSGIAMVIDNTRHIVLSGTGTDPASAVLIGTSAGLTGTNNYQLNASSLQFPATCTGEGFVSIMNFRSAAASFTMARGGGLYIPPGVKGSGSTITRYSSIAVDPSTIGTNNAVLTDAYSSYAAGNWFIIQSGTTSSSFGGQVGIAANGVGTSAVLAIGNGVVGQTLMSGTAQSAANFNIEANSSATLFTAGVLSRARTANSSFTTTFAGAFYEQALSKGAANTITRYVGYRTTPTTAATNNASLADNETFTGNWFINQSGTVASSFGGSVTLLNQLTVGNQADPGSYVFIGNNSAILSTVTQCGFRVGGTTSTFNASATSNMFPFRSDIRTDDGSYTTAVLGHFNQSRAILGTGHTVTREVSFRSVGKATGTVTQFAALTDNVTFTGDYFINQSGTTASSFGGQVRVASLGVANSAAATTPGTVTKKIEVFDATGASLGFIAVYDAIT